MSTIWIGRAILSVHNKEGLVPLGQQLASLNVEILSTGGTAKYLRESGVPVIDVAAYTGFPEILGGRVKTLHPKIAGGILMPQTSLGVEEAHHHGFGHIDLVVVNLYPFEETVRAQGANVDVDAAMEQMDIGGVTMIREGAKNHKYVTVVTHPSQYPALMAEMEHTSRTRASGYGGVSAEMRKTFAALALKHTARYCATEAAYLEELYLQG
ncbi:hypothetical protein BK004_02560 [bacterium CG10_46_32]|nr:MAG: hypothetical protein BK004_02560 [bacterium CG10_46_32]PIR56127.1 MAG: hypothetical protein COU73_02580 [Parcubacteria group bacterium CG10_big_fil_rev_8_21_14_0_10_46_32]